MARRASSSSSGGEPSIIYVRPSRKGVHRDGEATPSTPAVLHPLLLTTQTSLQSLPGMVTSRLSVAPHFFARKKNGGDQTEIARRGQAAKITSNPHQQSQTPRSWLGKCGGKKKQAGLGKESRTAVRAVRTLQRDGRQTLAV